MMITFEITSRVPGDAKLTLRLPEELANAEVRVRVETTSNGSTPKPESDGRPCTEAEWLAFIEETRGSIPDFPDVERPGPDDYERRGE